MDLHQSQAIPKLTGRLRHLPAVIMRKSGSGNMLEVEMPPFLMDSSTQTDSPFCERHGSSPKPSYPEVNRTPAPPASRHYEEIWEREYVGSQNAAISHGQLNTNRFP